MEMAIFFGTAGEGAGNLLEQVLGPYSSRLIFDWGLPGGFDSAEIALQISEHPDVWTDGGFVLDEVFGILSSGTGVQFPTSWR